MIESSTSKTLLQAPNIYELYHLDNEQPKNFACPCLTAVDIHKRLAHISHKASKYLLKHGMIQDIQLNSIGDKITCDTCIKYKITCKSIPKESGKWAQKLEEKVYSNVWEPSRHLNKKLYHVYFTDNYSRESVIYLMGLKDQVFSIYKLYKVMMLRQQDVCVKTLVSNHGGKYTSKEFKDYLTQKGKRHKLTVYDTPEQNGVAK